MAVATMPTPVLRGNDAKRFLDEMYRNRSVKKALPLVDSTEANKAARLILKANGSKRGR